MRQKYVFSVLFLTLSSAFAQVTAEDCPPTVMIGNDTYDLAGDIRKYGSAQSVLSKINESIRQELPVICSGSGAVYSPGSMENMLIRSNQRACEKTRTQLMAIKAAVEACIARVSSRSKAPPPADMSPNLAGSQSSIQPAGAVGGIDRSLFNTEDDSDGNAIFRKMAAAGTPFVPKNPQQDHTGEPCSYFTKPLVRPDGGGLNAYADGSAVAFGKFYYLCEDRRWVRLGPVSIFSNIHEADAVLLESRLRSTKVYEDE